MNSSQARDDLRAGLLESPVMPLDETLAIMRVLDSCRAQWGLRYPSDPPVNSLPGTDPARG